MCADRALDVVSPFLGGEACLEPVQRTFKWWGVKGQEGEGDVKWHTTSAIEALGPMSNILEVTERGRKMVPWEWTLRASCYWCNCPYLYPWMVHYKFGQTYTLLLLDIMCIHKKGSRQHTVQFSLNDIWFHNMHGVIPVSILDKQFLLVWWSYYS